MKRILMLMAAGCFSTAAWALANELSGETAKRNLEGIARFHRRGFPRRRSWGRSERGRMG
ncbi:MAG TPA: hypothetical protein VIW93_01890 [Candidatus Acidoferrum sp.]